MSVWSVMNWVAWALSAVLLVAILRDFIRVERGRSASDGQEGRDP